VATTRIAFLALLALVAVARVVEVIVSRARLNARPDALIREPGLFPLMVALHTGLILLPAAEVFLADRPFLPWLAAVAGGVLVLATGLRAWTLRTIGRAWNVRVVVPEEDRIVTHGPYAWIRHPNYLVVLLEVVSLPLLHGAWISSLGLSVLNAFVLARRIRTEEAALSQIPAWREAMADRKRLIPGLF
jgi:methyltransferase